MDGKEGTGAQSNIMGRLVLSGKHGDTSHERSSAQGDHLLVASAHERYTAVDVQLLSIGIQVCLREMSV